MTIVTAPAPTPVVPTRRSGLSDDLKQLLAVVLVTAVALGLGLALRASTENQTRTLETQGVRASIPASWVVQRGAGSLLFTAIDPQQQDRRYSVSRIVPVGPEAQTPAAAAENQAAARSRLLPGFRVLERTAAQVNGKSGVRMRYVFIDDQGALPAVRQGIDLFAPGTNGILVYSLVTPAERFDDALPSFDRFVASVTE